MSFRFRELERLGNSMTFTLKPDEQGLIGRECPIESCELYFKIKPGTGLKGKDLPCVCPYCGHKGPGSKFATKEQVEYAKSMAFRQVSDAIGRDLKQLEVHSSPGALVSLSVAVSQGRSPPIAHYRERQLETNLACSSCTLQYSVFGLFAFCPDCGLHNSRDILGANLDLVEKQVALALSQEEPALRRHLLEDAIENCVSAFDGFGREAVRVAQGQTDGPSISFQNLQRASAKLQQLFVVDMMTAVSADEWSAVHRSFMKRHLLSHRSGVVDEQYLSETSDPDAIRGHRIAIHEDEVKRSIGTLRMLGDWLVAQLPSRAG